MPNAVSACTLSVTPENPRTLTTRSLPRRPSFLAAPYDIMVTDGRVHDIDKDDMDRWCEYIFYRGLHRTAYARVSRGSVTDTELQVGQFAVPAYGPIPGEGEEVPEADRYLRGHREALPKEHVRLVFL
jgi:hypothetical protein